ncbi:MAG: type VI secretion system tip protein VgrG [Deltaproteobacteria bacterium]|nr:type VI secretion system tip protein VgrG [Deltaproteobacteria bacterium]
MAIDEKKRFTFVSQGLPEDTFAVAQFKGAEGISRLYEYDITLASDDPEIDLKGVLQNPATLTIHGDDQDRPIHGILAQFEQLHEVKGRYFYRALLVPRLWQADLYRENQLFLDKTVPDIIEEILKQAGLTTRDYELKLTKNYPRWEYICQYRETDFDFISRWMEREGIYYFFEQGEQGEKLIITDSSTAHRDIPGNTTIPFAPPSGLMPEEEAIKAFICRQKRLPNRVILKDYNYRKPSLDLKTETVVDAKGRGNVYFYGEHFKTPEEGNELAKVRAEEIRCRENVFHGEGTEPALCPGFTFEMAGHYRGSYNQKYLVVDVEHQGGQTEAFAAGTGEELTEKEQQLTYANAFTAIPANVQFRPECKTPKPRFYGTMNAKVDAAGIGQYAEIDDEGRYKVKLPFDQEGTEGGKASRWVRMVQPYAGADHGMHFPLHKGTEVLLTFVDGDPDRPIIAGAVPNVETKSVVTSQNASRNTIRSAGGNVLEMEDMAGAERILLSSPHESTYLHMGAPNSPARTLLESTGGQMLHRSRRNMYTEVGGPDFATEKEFPGEFTETDRTERKDGAWAGQKIFQSTERDKGHYYLTAKGDHRSNVENRTENVRKKKEEKIGRHKKDAKDNKNDEYYYERTVADTGELTEKIFDGSHNQTYERTVEDTGKLTEEIFDDKYKREIDSSSGNLTEEVAGTLTLQSDGKMLLKTTNGDIEINAADQGRDVIIKANRRQEYTNSEWEENHFGNKLQFVGGANAEFFLGNNASATLGALEELFLGINLSLFAGAKFDFEASFGYSASAIKIKEHSLEIKNKKAEIDRKVLNTEIADALKIVL